MTSRVIVVGAGVIGCAIARALAPEYEVHVIERDEIGSGATNRGAGEVTISPSYTDYPAIAEHANEFFRSYDGTGEFWFTDAESVELVAPDRADEARRRVERLAETGVDVTFLDPSTVERRYPELDLSEFAGAVRHGDTGYTDPPTLVETLAADARSRGATITTGTAVTGIEGGDAVDAVDTTDGRISADAVVVAAGWQTPELHPDVDLPVRPYRTQCAVFDLGTALSDAFPMGWVPGGHVYFRPTRERHLLVGGWSFAEDSPEDASRDSDTEFQNHVRDTLPAFVDGFDGATLVDDWAGVDAATPDTRPIIDTPANAPDGLVVATGFHGRGIMTAPVAATVVRSLVADEPAPFPTAPFRVDRFDDRGSDFEFTSISAGDY